jgi:CheY-like chemotaxis protein
MFRHPVRYLIVVGFLAALVAHAPAQDKDKDKNKDKGPPVIAPPKKDPLDEYRQFLKPPETALEYWGAIQFELELGSYELASRHLRGLLEKKKPTADELFELERHVGMAAILRLHSQFAPWLREVAREQKKLDALSPEDKALPEVKKKIDEFNTYAQTDKNVDTLVTQTTAAVRKFLDDPIRIKKYVALLYASPEEQQFALKELYQSGAAVVPHMIDAMKVAEPEKRAIVLSALRLLGPEVLPALVAALDSNDAALKLDLIDLFLARGAREVAPHLWFVAANGAEPEKVRNRAREALAYFSLPPERLSKDNQRMQRELAKALAELPPSKGVLTRQAEKYYRHEVPFSDPKMVTVWRWDGKNVVAGWPGAPTVSASKAEEYWGVRFAAQALTLDPAYRPAQDLLVSLLLEKTYEQGGLDRPLAKADPNVQAVVASINPDVLVSVLEKALDEKRVALILAATRLLGDVAEVRAVRPTERAQPALTRALLFAYRRVQMAAAEALLRVPEDRTPLTGARIAEVFRRALAADAGAVPKVLIGFEKADFANQVAEAAKQAGYEPVIVKTGKELLKRAFEASDIEAIIFDADLPEPGLTSVLGQLRGDPYAGRLPLLVTPSHRQADLLVDELKRLDEQLKGAAAVNRPVLQFRRDEVEGQLKVQLMNSEAALERFAKAYRHMFPVAASSLINARDLQPLLQARLDVAVNPPLAPPELKENSEKAVRYLARAAKGEWPGLDAGVAADTVFSALRARKLSPEGQIAALEIAGRLPGRAAQTELLRALLDAPDQRPAPVRLAAAAELVRHMQRYNSNLAATEVMALRDAYAKSTDAPYKAALAAVFGALHPDARATGDILRGFQPNPPAAPLPMPKPVPAPDK